jgi:hypothetical protein
MGRIALMMTAMCSLDIGRLQAARTGFRVRTNPAAANRRMNHQ